MNTSSSESGGPHLVVMVPVYNEVTLLEQSLDRLMATPTPTVRGVSMRRTIILVDDGSTDGTTQLVRTLGQRPGVLAVFHEHNRGKGSALRTALDQARTLSPDAAIIHDADLEYDPADHAAVLAPILDGRADAVIGSRFLGQTHRVLYYWHFLANTFITLCSNIMTNLNLTDIECCFKAFSRQTLEKITINEPRFGVEPELVAKLSKMRLPREESPARQRRARIFEVPVSYSGRTYEEGKKIGPRDGVRALWCILKYNLR